MRLPPALRPLFPFLKAIYTLGTRVAAPVAVQLSRARGGYLPRGVSDTMEDAATRGGGRTWQVLPAEVVTRTIPNGVPQRASAFVDNVTEAIPRVAVIELPNGRVLGPYSAVISGTGDLLQELSFYFGTTRPREHPLFLHPFPGAPVEVPGRLGVLASRGDAHYYHFLMDVLARLGVLDACPDVEPPDRWYVPAATSFQRELLDSVGIGEAQRIDSTQVPHVRAECLVVPGLPSNIVRNPPWVPGYLRSRLLPPGLARVPGRHIYVTRGEQRHNRIVTNEAEVVQALEQQGFELVDAGAHSVAEQVRIFAEADVIVSPHGGALANLVFCSPGSTVIELFPAGSLVPDYWKLAAGVTGLEYRYLGGVGPPAGTGRAAFHVSDITVDVEALLTMLDDLWSAAAADH